MKKILIAALFLPVFLSAQSFENEIETFRNQYIAEHLQESHSPIKYQEVALLDFYEANQQYQVQAKVNLINDTKGFTMLTHTGKKKQYYKYARLNFTINNQKQTLYLYQSKRLIQKKEYRDYLFLPFTDATNYQSTFGGGRYIDFTLDDIQNNEITLDFNKSYNPYCAYAGGFNCPIPPKENRLDIAIKAGEKLYLGKAEPTH
jgi:uncharacterized protein (DUF1684 family)